MPAAQQNRTTINARRFAALLAGFDTGNASEVEALAKARALRRLAMDANMRIVDALELPDVRAAIDAQLQPLRFESPDLQVVMERAEALREELTERTRNVRELSDRLREQEEMNAALRADLANAKKACMRWRPSFGVPCWEFELFVVCFAVGIWLGELSRLFF